MSNENNIMSNEIQKLLNENSNKSSIENIFNLHADSGSVDVSKGLVKMETTLGSVDKYLDSLTKSQLEQVMNNKKTNSLYIKLSENMSNLNDIKESDFKNYSDYEDALMKSINKLNSGVDELSNDMTAQLSFDKEKLSTALPVIAKFTGVVGAVALAGWKLYELGDVIYDSFDKNSEWLDSLAKREREFSSNRAIDEELWLSVNKQKAQSIVTGYKVEKDILENKKILLDEKAELIAKENGITKEEVLANKEKYISLTKIITEIDNVNVSLDGWRKKLRDVDDDLHGGVLEMAYIEEKISKIESKMKNSKVGSDEYVELESERKKLHTRKNVIDVTSKIAQGEDTNIDVIQLDKDIQDYIKQEKLVSKFKEGEGESSRKKLNGMREHFKSLDFDEGSIEEMIISVKKAMFPEDVDIDSKFKKMLSESSNSMFGQFSTILDAVGSDDLAGNMVEMSDKRIDKLTTKLFSYKKLETDADRDHQSKIDKYRKDNNLHPTSYEYTHLENMNNKAMGGKLSREPTIVGENGAEIIQGGKVLSPLNTQHNDKLTDIIKNAMSDINVNSNNGSLEELMKQQNTLLGQILQKNQGGSINNNTNVNNTNVQIKPKSGNRFAQ